MRSLDRLPERALVVELRQRALEVAELKGSFQALGSSSVRTHRIFSGNPYDFEFIASGTPGTIIFHRVDVEFIPDNLRFGGAFCHRVYARVFDADGEPQESFRVDALRQRRSDGRQVWSLHHVSFGYPTDTLRIKLYFFATGSGTFSVTVIH
jgi:hypothetical protein